MKKIILFLFFGFAFLKQSNSQILREWVYDFNPSGINYGYGHGVVCDHHDNVYISGIISNGTSMLLLYIHRDNISILCQILILKHLILVGFFYGVKPIIEEIRHKFSMFKSIDPPMDFYLTLEIIMIPYQYLILI